jgi:hypothetical protein
VKWYKYLEAKYAKGMVENGTLRLGALSSYQNIEQLGAAIGDQFENTKTVYTADKEVKTSVDQLNWLEKERLIRIGPNARVSNMVVWNNSISLKVPGEALFAYCVSTECGKDIMEKMSTENVKAGTAPYDACVEVKDALEFVSVLTKILRECGFTYRGHGNCSYRGRLFHWSVPTDDLLTWQLKDDVYAYQKECRIVFAPPQGYSLGRFMIYGSQAIRDCCRLLML